MTRTSSARKLGLAALALILLLVPAAPFGHAQTQNLNNTAGSPNELSSPYGGGGGAGYTTSGTFTTNAGGSPHTEYFRVLDRFRASPVQDLDGDGFVSLNAALTPSAARKIDDLPNLTDTDILTRIVALGVTKDKMEADVDAGLSWNPAFDATRASVKLDIDNQHYKDAVLLLRSTPLAMTYWCGIQGDTPTGYLWTAAIPYPMVCNAAKTSRVTAYTALNCQATSLTSPTQQRPWKGCFEPAVDPSGWASHPESTARDINLVNMTTTFRGEDSATSYLTVQMGVGWRDHQFGAIAATRDLWSIQFQLTPLTSSNPVANVVWGRTTPTAYFDTAHPVTYTWGYNYSLDRSLTLANVGTSSAFSAIFQLSDRDTGGEYVWNDPDWEIRYLRAVTKDNNPIHAYFDLKAGNALQANFWNLTDDQGNVVVPTFLSGLPPVGAAGTKHVFQLYLNSSTDVGARPIFAWAGESSYTYSLSSGTFGSGKIVGLPSGTMIVGDDGSDGDLIPSVDVVKQLSSGPGYFRGLLFSGKTAGRVFDTTNDNVTRFFAAVGTRNPFDTTSSPFVYHGSRPGQSSISQDNLTIASSAMNWTWDVSGGVNFTDNVSMIDAHTSQYLITPHISSCDPQCTGTLGDDDKLSFTVDGAVKAWEWTPLVPNTASCAYKYLDGTCL